MKNDEKYNISNTKEYYWNDITENGEVYEGNKKSKYFAGFNSGDGYLSYNTVNESQFLSAIAGVGVLFIKADLVLTYKSKKFKFGSVGFWLESARRYNGGGEDEINGKNRRRIKKYCKYFKWTDGRYDDLVDKYLDYIDTLR